MAAAAKIGALVCITWFDACFDLTEASGCMQMQTIGWLISRDKQLVCIAGERAANNGSQYRQFTSIPRSCVQHITKL